jgi:rhodanese-related sulfurtransferase
MRIQHSLTFYFPLRHVSKKKYPGLLAQIGILFFLLLMAPIHAMASEGQSPMQVAGTQSVTVEQAKRLFVQGAKFIDVRSAVGFDAGRIPGAKLLDLKKNFTQSALAKFAAQDEPIIIYCSGPVCSRAAKAASKAVKWGYSKVYYFRDGLPGWKQAAHPVE